MFLCFFGGFGVFSLGRVVLYTVFLVFVPPPNRGQNPGQTSEHVFVCVKAVWKHMLNTYKNIPEKSEIANKPGTE